MASRDFSQPLDAPKVLFVGEYDWANICNRAARAMNSVTGTRNARVWTLKAHPFGYQEDLIGDGIEATEEAQEIASDVDWIITSGDGNYEVFLQMFEKLTTPEKADLAVTHAGSAYRNSASWYNALDEDMLHAKVRFVCPDLLRLATSGPLTHFHIGSYDPIIPPYAPPPIDRKIVIAHSPSRRATKGTELIMPVLEQLVRNHPHDVEIDLIENVSFQETLNRRARAHIFVDQMNPDVRGFGLSAIEAMAVGCTVVGDFEHARTAMWDILEVPQWYNVAHAYALERVLENPLMRPEQRGGLVYQRRECLRWATAHAGPTAVGRDWWIERLRRVKILTETAAASGTQSR